LCLDLNEEEGGKLEMQFKDVLLFRSCDVRDSEAIESAIQAAQTKWPRRKLAGLVHCAGVGMAFKTLQHGGEDGPQAGPQDAFEQTILINLAGTFNVARLVAAAIARQYPALPSGYAARDSEPVADDRGVLVFTSSSSYEDGQDGQAAYAASKGGVASLCLPMARDLARYGIRVMAIAPSLFDTAMGANMPSKVKDNLLRSTLFPQRFGTADEFAALAASIIENGYLNGGVVRLDGGTRMSRL